MKAELHPITEAHIPAVADFLTSELNPRVSPSDWAAAMAPAWPSSAPNHGFMLRVGDQVVGAYLAFYSDRVVAGQPERFCNLGAWCVRPEYRFQSVRLLQALLKQRDFCFTDLSPSGNVLALNRRLGFAELDPTTTVIPHLPWPTWPGRTVIEADPEVIAARLARADPSGRGPDIFRDHRAATAALHLAVIRGDRVCHVILRRDRRKGLPIFASLLYASDPDLLIRSLRPLTRHLLFRHRILATLIETRVLGRSVGRFHSDRFARPKMYKSAHLAPEQIDNLYSELVCVPW